MADRELIGNCALYVLLGLSAIIWAKVIARKLRGQTAIDPVSQAPVSWPALPVCVTFLVAYLVPILMMFWVTPPAARDSAGEIPAISVTNLQWKCASQVVQVALVVGLLALTGPLKKEDFGCAFEHWRTDAWIGVAGWLASMLPVFIVTTWQGILEWRSPEDKHALLKALSTADGGLLFWIIVSAAVLAPIGEELFYRVLLQGWAQSQMAAWKAIAFSSFVFVVQHPDFDRLPLIPLALILGYVYNRRHSFVSVVVLHALFNSVMLALATLTAK